MDFRSFQEIQKIRKKRQKPEQKSIQKINRKKNEKHAKIMQKSDATPGSLQNPVSDQFWDHFGRVPGGKIHPGSQKRVPKVHAKKQQIFGSPKFLPRDGPRAAKGSQGSALGGPTPI